jgi:hypothetical protein
MAKTVLVCPFSKSTCIECPIYRGRHTNVCFAAGYHGGTLHKGANNRTKPTNGSNVRWELPEDLNFRANLKNYEDKEENILEWRKDK